MKNPIISLPELKRLVVDLLDRGAGISIRYRLIGEMWYHNFVKITSVDETGMILIDEITDKRIFIPDLSSIIQFELDGRFQSFQAHLHYEVAIRPQFIIF